MLYKGSHVQGLLRSFQQIEQKHAWLKIDELFTPETEFFNIQSEIDIRILWDKLHFHQLTTFHACIVN